MDAIELAQARLEAKRRELGITTGAPSVTTPGAAPTPSEVQPLQVRRFQLQARVHPIASLAVAFQRICSALAEIRQTAAARGIPTSGPTWNALLAFEVTRGWNTLRRALAQGRLLVAVSGDVGTGKTVLLAHTVLWDQRPGRTPPCWVAAGYAWEALAHPFDDERRALRARMEATDLLALDDLGTEGESPAGMAAFRELLVRRYDAGKLTLLSSNLDPAALRERYFDARLRDRAAEGGSAVQLAGKSRRRKAR